MAAWLVISWSAMPLALAVDLLETAVAAGTLPDEADDPGLLDHLCRLLMVRLVRGGPAREPGPGELVAFAETHAAAGRCPPELPGSLRSVLNALAEEARAIGFWSSVAPAWWSPLPEPGPVERACDGIGLDLPERGVCGALEPEQARRLILELSAALDAGVLRPERAGVGRGEIEDARQDEVVYLDGLERGLFAVAPSLCALIRGLLTEQATKLGFHAPQKVMLARYTAPTGGYRAHLDNPGGQADNGRAVTLTLYLSDPDAPRRGGALAVWRPGAGDGEAPERIIEAEPGTAVLFDSRTVPHRVLPLEEGERWALVVWYNAHPQRGARPVPRLEPGDMLRAVPDPPLDDGRVISRRLADGAEERLTVHAPRTRPRVGIVSTVYRGGVRLEKWCAHHLEAGVDHLILIFDHAEEPDEQQTIAGLRTRFDEDVLTIWTGARVASSRWPQLRDERLDEPRTIATSGNSAQAVAARQMLNAGAALRASQQEGAVPGGLDWLVHLDGDEQLVPMGAGAGGTDLRESFAVFDEAGILVARFLNHELLLEGERPIPRFKLNPRLAEARLGPIGWRQLVAHLGLEQEGPRPWFTGYHNGKAAVRIEAGILAAGVHGWYTKPAGVEAVVNGPVVLHFHFLTRETFVEKYIAIAESPVPARLFRPSPVEEAALACHAAALADGRDPRAALAALHGRLTRYRESEIGLLEEAGLLIEPSLAHPL